MYNGSAPQPKQQIFFLVLIFMFVLTLRISCRREILSKFYILEANLYWLLNCLLQTPPLKIHFGLIPGYISTVFIVRKPRRLHIQKQEINKAQNTQVSVTPKRFLVRVYQINK